jgi:hypothetical protein
LACEASNFCRHNGRKSASDKPNNRNSSMRAARSIGTVRGNPRATKKPTPAEAAMIA